MKVVAMIPIKLNNERLPGKNLKIFSDGTPLVKFIQKSCINAKMVDEVYLYCSSTEIIPYLISNVKFVKRPSFLDNDDSNCNDIIREFMKVIDADIYVVSHATGPFTTSDNINNVIEGMVSGDYDSGFLATEIRQFLWKKNGALNFDLNNFPRTQDLEPIYCETPGAYVFYKETFIQYNRRVGATPYIHKVTELEGRDIDTVEDFTIADMLYSSINKVRLNNDV